MYELLPVAGNFSPRFVSEQVRIRLVRYYLSPARVTTDWFCFPIEKTFVASSLLGAISQPLANL
jgi:hypothetical protein